MPATLDVLERRRDALIRRIAVEREQIVLLASGVSSPARKLERVEGALAWALRHGWSVGLFVLPALAFIFRSSTLVRRATQAVTALRIVRSLGDLLHHTHRQNMQ